MQNSILKRDLAEAVDLFPKLHFDEVAKTLEGEIDICDALGNYVDSFNILINVPKRYPYAMPSLYETGRKLDHIADRHFNDDESCCVCSLQEADITGQRGITLTAYLKRYCVPFFANQIYFDIQKNWANGEYAHGIPGIYQYYSEILNIDDFDSVLTILVILNQKKLQRNDKCFCGSGVKLKFCHNSSYNTIKDISRLRFKEDLNLLNRLKVALEDNAIADK